MKEIKLKKMRMIYFKGFKDFEVEFKDRTVISGRNRSGKSSIADAWFWLLFGKDSLGNTDFDIKTIVDGKLVEKVDHEVYAELEINGSKTTLKRVLCEKWKDDKLTGHVTKCYFDGVPVSVGDYQSRVNDIVDENMFRLITNTNHFHSLKREERRNILVSIAGEISNEEISKGKFDDVIEMLKSNSMADLKAKIADEKKRIEEEISHIPTRIDEIKKGMPEAVDFKEIEKQIEEKKEKLSEIDKAIADRQNAMNDKIEAANEKRKQVGELRAKQNDIVINAGQEAVKIAAEKNKDFYNYEELLKDKQDKVTRFERKVLEKKNEIDGINYNLKELRETREKLVQDWKNEQAKVYNDEQDDSCPFCGHVFTDKEKLETRQSGEGEFNKIKTEKLTKINSEGLKVKQRILDYEKTLSEMEKELLSIKSEHESAVQDYSTFSKIKPEKVDPKPVVKEELNEWVELDKQIRLISIEEVRVDNSELMESRRALSDEIVSLSVELNKKTQIENSFKRIEELEKENRDLSQKLSEQKGIEHRIISFNKLKMEEVDRRINDKFKMVKFRLFDKTLGGDDVETCETLINGVRYFSANNEARINAGLDIIGVINEYNGIYAPIFVDNAEGLNEIIPTKSQLIELKVTTGNLTVE